MIISHDEPPNDLVETTEAAECAELLRIVQNGRRASINKIVSGRGGVARGGTSQLLAGSKLAPGASPNSFARSTPGPGLVPARGKLGDVVE